jgi:hypothetical protein
VSRKLALALVLMSGLFWLGSTFAFNYPAKTQAVDNLTNSFRPVFSNAGISQSQEGITTIDRFASQFQTQAVPALATELHVTPTQLVTALSQKYPAVGAGLHQLPTSLPYFNHLVAGLAAQQQNFHLADAIPTKNLPTTTVHWLFVILGVVAIAMALVGFLFRQRLAQPMIAAAAVLGIVVIAVSLILSVPTKAKAVDQMTNAFRPVFTSQGASQARAYLTTVEAMDRQLTSQAVPGLAAMLHVTPTQLATSLGKSFPAVGAGLTQLPQILTRFDVLVTLIEHNVTNFHLADSIPTKGTHTTMLEAQLAGPAGVLAVFGLLGLLVPWVGARQQKRHPLPARRSMVSVG